MQLGLDGRAHDEGFAHALELAPHKDLDLLNERVISAFIFVYRCHGKRPLYSPTVWPSCLVAGCGRKEKPSAEGTFNVSYLLMK